ncbi:hypothetical protein [Acetobacter malorum]|uniref:hypothetical protein n=1 Tax=Acetobacter malorum TaxID=178901 RepID=UPI00248E0222|nr:hypothetical protein [Acetobacter malorum]
MIIATGGFIWRSVVIAGREEQVRRDGLFHSTVIALAPLEGEDFDFASAALEEYAEKHRERLLGVRFRHFLSGFSGFCLIGGRLFPHAVNGLGNLCNQIKCLFLGFHASTVGVVKTRNQSFTRNPILRVFKRHQKSPFCCCGKHSLDDVGGCGNVAAQQNDAPLIETLKGQTGPSDFNILSDEREAEIRAFESYKSPKSSSSLLRRVTSGIVHILDRCRQL